MNPLRIMLTFLFLFFGPCILYGDGDIYVIRKDYPVAVSEADLDLFRYSMKENHTGLWVNLRQEGRAWLSRPGIVVTIIEKKHPDKVKVQTVDSHDTFWTSEDALEKK